MGGTESLLLDECIHRPGQPDGAQRGSSDVDGAFFAGAAGLSSLLSTVSSRSWMRSNVVKRAAQASHWRRRRIAAPSSVGRLSFTCESSLPQKGQRNYSSG